MAPKEHHELSQISAWITAVSDSIESSSTLRDLTQPDSALAEILRQLNLPEINHIRKEGSTNAVYWNLPENGAVKLRAKPPIHREGGATIDISAPASSSREAPYLAISTSVKNQRALLRRDFPGIHIIRNEDEGVLIQAEYRGTKQMDLKSAEATLLNRADNVFAKENLTLRVARTGTANIQASDSRNAIYGNDRYRLITSQNPSLIAVDSIAEKNEGSTVIDVRTPSITSQEFDVPFRLTLKEVQRVLQNTLGSLLK